MMIDLTQIQMPLSAPIGQTGKPAHEKLFRMKHDNDRMAGSMPVWEYRKTTVTQNQIEGRLANAAAQQIHEDKRFDTAMAYAMETNEKNVAPPSQPENFGLGDLLDIVNPLQHLPLVGHIYRAVTGDEIKPSMKIVGGALYGGVAGAASGIANAIIEEETGKDISGNVMAMVKKEKNISQPLTPPQNIIQPEAQISRALAALEENPKGGPTLPPTLMGFTDQGIGRRKVYEYIPAADGRMAGSMIRVREEISAPDPIRQPITQVTLQPMPEIETETDNYSAARSPNKAVPTRT